MGHSHKIACGLFTDRECHSLCPERSQCLVWRDIVTGLIMWPPCPVSPLSHEPRVARSVARVTGRAQSVSLFRLPADHHSQLINWGNIYNNTGVGSKTPYHSRNVKLGTNEIKRTFLCLTQITWSKKKTGSIFREPQKKYFYECMVGYTLLDPVSGCEYNLQRRWRHISFI